MNYCKIDAGLVVDRIVFDGSMPADWPDYEAWVAHEEAQIGWLVADDDLVPPPPSEAEQPFGPRLPNLEPDQFWFVVRASGYEPELLAWVEAMKDEPSPANWAAASSKLDFGKFFERDHPFVEDARQAIGMSVQELDALWLYGAA